LKSGAGIVYDLEEIEKDSQKYPLTISFCKLLDCLFETSELPMQLGESSSGWIQRTLGKQFMFIQGRFQMIQMSKSAHARLVLYVSFK
jgi:hypothetical protein